MNKKFVCEMCGAEFEAVGNHAKYCSEPCKKRAAHQNQRKNLYSGHPRARSTYYAYCVNEKTAAEERKRNQEEIKRIAVEAKELGLSYGKYVAMMEMNARGL